MAMLACAPALMVVVSLFERRWGPKMAGLAAAAPVTALIGLLLVDLDLGAAVSHDMAAKMSGYVPAQVAIAFVVAVAVGRAGLVPALALGVAAFAALVSLSLLLPTSVAILISLATLAVAYRLVTTARIGPASVDPASVGPGSVGAGGVAAAPTRVWWMLPLRAVVSLLTAFGLLLMAHQFGPSAGGAVGAFPIFTMTLITFIFGSAGVDGVKQTLAGMVEGLLAYFAFVVTYGVALPAVGTVSACVAGIVACALCYLLQARTANWSAHGEVSPRTSRDIRLATRPSPADAAVKVPGTR